MKSEATKALKDFDFAARTLVNEGLTFTLLKTRSAMWIEFDGGFVFKQVNLPEDFKLMALMSKVKSDARKFLDAHPDFQFDGKPKYFDWKFSKCLAMTGSDVKLWKVDISAAYWNMARKLFVSESTYDYGKNYKKIRLRALGSLATMETEMKYVSGVLEEYETRPKNSRFRMLYVWTTYEISNVMSSLLKIVTSALGFWTDCFFCITESDAEKIAGYIRLLGFKTSEYVQKTYRFVISDASLILIDIDASTDSNLSYYYVGNNRA